MIIADEHYTYKEKVKLIWLAPLAYPFFFTVSLVEYAGLIKSIIQIKGIIHARENKICNWDPVERTGGIPNIEL